MLICLQHTADVDVSTILCVYFSRNTGWSWGPARPTPFLEGTVRGTTGLECAYQCNKNKNKPTITQCFVLFVCLFLPFLRTWKDASQTCCPWTSLLLVECSEGFSSDAAREAPTIPSLGSCVRGTYVPRYWLSCASRSGIGPFKNYSEAILRNGSLEYF